MRVTPGERGWGMRALSARETTEPPTRGVMKIDVGQEGSEDWRSETDDETCLHEAHVT